MNWKRPLSLTLSAALSLSLAGPALAADETAAPWYAEAQAYVTEQGLMIGTGAGFDPDAVVTRATVFQTLYNAEGKPARSDDGKAYFTDTAGTWYAAAADWAAETGLAQVPAEQCFYGARAITRAELAVIFARFAADQGRDTSAGGMAMREMADYDAIPAWALEGMGVCYYNGILTGKPGNLLDPGGTAVRAELAVMLRNYSKLSPADADSLTVSANVTEIEKYGHAVLDETVDDFNAKGFALGDIVTVTAGDYSADMPYLDGYYVDSGEPMLRAYPGKEYLAVCINYGKFNEVAGVAVGSSVTVALKEKGGAAALQATYSLKYTNDRADYESDEVFANFRAVTAGDIGAGMLYRSASPINNENGRAATADKLIEAAGVKTVMNLADTDEEIAGYAAGTDFASPYYMSLYNAGSVVTLGMPVNYASDEFADGIVKGLTFLSGREGPYLIHCTEGKDRAGFTAALLEALMGASLDEIVADYMQSYINYYHMTAADGKYDLIARGNVMEMLRAVAGLDKGADLSQTDLAQAAETYLTAHGMQWADVAALKTNLKG